MAKLALTTTPVRIARASQQPALLNQGPGIIWLGYSSAEADAADGFPIAPDAGYEFPKDLERDLYASSASTSDLRILMVG